MQQKIEKIQIKDLPQELFEEIEEKIRPYVIGLLGVNVSTSGEEAELVGSGTLVRVANKYGILTAQHVTEELMKFHKVGLNLGAFVHKFAIATEFLPIVEIGGRHRDNIGPDLALMILPGIHIGTINAIKSFWNLSYYAKTVLSKRLVEDIGIHLWTVFGFVGVWSKNGGPAAGFDKTKDCFGLFGFTGAEEYWTVGDFDYLKLSVLYKNRTDLPLSFGGVSGGGIWRTELFRSNDGRISCLNEPLFLGVAFYQTAIKNSLRSLIGHGWRSIYEQLLRFVTDASSVM
jgi:hypothetical protein